MPNDLAMARALGPILPAAAVAQLPFTVFGTFLVPIAANAGTSVAALGSLRGLGGIAAVAVGLSLAPLIDRVPKRHVAAAALTLLAFSAILGAKGHFVAMVTFCLLTGAATAMLGPAVTAAAADRFGDGPAAGRAATLVIAAQALTAILAAPLVALPSLLWGWQGTLLAVATVSMGLGIVFLRQQPPATAPTSAPTGYLQTLRALTSVPGAIPVLVLGLLRTGAFMGYIAYLAGLYDARFDLSPNAFALVWTLSGSCFFTGNLLAGRITNAAIPPITPERLLTVTLFIAIAATGGVYFAPTLPTALLATAILATAHAAAAACGVTILVQRTGNIRGSALALNAAGVNLGIFTGSALGGLGLSIAGYTGTAVALGAMTLAATAIASILNPRKQHRAD